MEKQTDLSFCKGLFEKFRERRLFIRGEFFVRTDIIAIEDSEVMTIPARIMRERLNSDHELNMSLMLGLFEELLNYTI